MHYHVYITCVFIMAALTGSPNHRATEEAEGNDELNNRNQKPCQVAKIKMIN